MTSCSVTNSSSISCDYGCCGTPDNRTCCDFKLSESLLIVICVVGALVVVGIVVALIICLTSSQKTRVTRIRPRQRLNMHDHESRIRRVVIPKPPPYSETPPQYDADFDTENARSTEPILPRHRTSNTRANRGQRQSRRQNTSPDRRNTNRGQLNDAPPSYISVIQMEQHDVLHERNDSPEPGTSGQGRFGSNEPGVISVMDRTRHGSPHPSLASGRISASMFNGPSVQTALHKTASERSRRQFGIRGNNSVTPVTIREITVHSPTRHNPNITNNNSTGSEAQRRNVFNSKIPRPSKGKALKNESRNVKSTNAAMKSTGLLPGALEDNNLLHLGESPPPVNPSAAARSAQRHAILHRLQQRKSMTSPPPVQ